ncbi:hypothetical protein XhyaCFBP1156_03220 [Xanthomonas hyacinthi]|uniref:Uncharacterized protein n=1 Tax=Xanthomonas hyacinthi TaxID=56455 RepID=A0A2S7F1V7_9XANT|nr:hypothetical protein Y886_07750 [Xanthomonas hyacinthi DSM 19077]PPU99294.1 hypothetical protein XhyaCFBP1156_03220 [Xanthomonas hyacinthi]
MQDQLADCFFYAAIGFLLVKVASTYFTVNVDDSTRLLETSGKRIGYLLGKVSPSLCLACLMCRAILQHENLVAVGYACLLLVLVPVTIAVMRARRRGTWFGIVHMLRRK